MGSINDLWLCQVNGNPVPRERESEINAQLEALRSRAWQLAKTVANDAAAEPGGPAPLTRTFTSFQPGERHYPALGADLKAQLAQIVPSVSGDLEYFPCCVRTKDGRDLDRVYVVSAQPYIALWGIWPDQDAHKFEVRLADVEAIRESPTRLPPGFANELYRAGESGMGYTVFTVRFRDGSERSYVGGNAIDFISLPLGQTTRDIVGVTPHAGRDRAVSDSTPYYWCIHGHGRPHGA
jgi:hypothetical protein